MRKLVIWGTGSVGCKAFDILKESYDIIAWGDNDIHKQGTFFYNLPVMSSEQIANNYIDMKICVAISDYYKVAKELSDIGLKVEGYFAEDNTICNWEYASWNSVLEADYRFLYAGDLHHSRRRQFPQNGFLCLSIARENEYTVLHDMRNKIPVDDNSIDFFQSEDVFEHIELDYILDIIQEIYRILKPEGVFRLSLPDYYSPIVKYYSFMKKDGSAVFDPHGGGCFIDGHVMEGGHLWFPNIDLVKDIIDKSSFKKVTYYRYHRKDESLFKRKIDHTIGYISRCEEHIDYHQDISIVCDLLK